MSVLVFIDGYFSEILSEISGPLEFSPIKARAELLPAELITTMDEQSCFFHVPPHCKLTQPIQLIFLSSGQICTLVQPQHVFVLGEHSSATIIEEHVSAHTQAYYHCAINLIVAEQHARLDFYKIHNATEHHYLAKTVIQQKQYSHVEMGQFSLGGSYAHDTISVLLEEPHAECYARGFYITDRDADFVGNHVYIQHKAPSCKSDMFYKGILQKKSSSTFTGKVLVEKDAQKTSAQQANHNLLLAKNAETTTRPQLEIYADDVQCKHGATVGELDLEALFYLTSRGVTKAQAVQLLLRGFACEVIQKIRDQRVLAHVENLLSTKLLEVAVC